MDFNELRAFLDEKTDLYNRPDFIESDPIQIPHQFTLKEDIEIAGFLASVIAWGNRKMIIKNAQKMMELMGNTPYDFIMSHEEHHLENLENFVHRTFNGQDFIGFVKGLQHIYMNHNGLEAVFTKHVTDNSTQNAIANFKTIFFETPHLQRTEKHLPNPTIGSAAKRINMYLRWMVRNDNRNVDFGLWKNIPTSALSCPLDVHSGNVARKLGLLTRKQN
uniref:TIGR02757 family protein n=1 Tax=Flavobacterium sp. H122 TaxID=2529860 RepID=UPI0010AA1E97